ncbi:MAG: hypothetical protein AXW15_07870 [Neptuniibacter sp. Phe_28]|nr:MAG: hypothetical protein AXW15_07870 [Neptuniibacter sp. Phe_28]
MNDKAIENITEIMQAMAVLPEKEFDEALLSVATIAVCTLKARNGRRFLKDFMKAAIEDTGEQPVLIRQGLTH